MKIKLGDIVVVVAGKDKGKQGEVIRVFADSSEVVVKGVNMVVRHLKKTRDQSGKKVEKEAPIHVSNVMYFNKEKGQASRLGYSLDDKLGKVRVFKKDSSSIKDVFKRS